MNRIIIFLKRIVGVINFSFRKFWRFIKKISLRTISNIKELYHKIPASNRVKISVLLVISVLILVMIALLCVPNSKQQIPEGVSLCSRPIGSDEQGRQTGSQSLHWEGGETNDSSSAGTSGISTSTVSGANPWQHTSDAVPPDMSVPATQTPAGGKAGYTPSAREKTLWEQLLIYLEQCEGFQYQDSDKEKKLAVGAARMAIELHDYTGVNEACTEYWIDDKDLQNYYFLLSGQCMRGGELDRLQWEKGSYHYTQPSFVSNNVHAELTSVYLLDSGFYRVEGIVTRGLPSEAGAYSRRLIMILTPDPVITTSFYVLALENHETRYTPLENFSVASESTVLTSAAKTGEASMSSVLTSPTENVSSAEGVSEIPIGEREKEEKMIPPSAADTVNSQ